MSWLISLVLAGVVFSADTSVPVRQNNFTSNETTTKVVRLDETVRVEQTYPLNSNGRVRVQNVNGSITIDTWDRNEVKLEAVKTADDKESLADVEIKINATRESISIETEYDTWKRENTRVWKTSGKLQVDYRLTVPRNAVLDGIDTVNGSISITNSNNMTKAATVNGQIVATNLRGTAELSTVNGALDANFDQLQSSSRINLNTVNGVVNLVIPSDANATVKADSLNGSITNDFGLPVRKGEYVGRNLYGRIGSGEVQIRLNSVNGGLHVKRKSDGRTVNPAVNLLPPKTPGDNDFDNDNDNDGAINIDKMNREIKRSVKDAQKESAAATRNAQKELMKAQKELEKLKPEIKINEAEIQTKVQESLRRQPDGSGRIADVNFNAVMPFIEKKSETLNVKGTPKVDIDARNCAVSVRGWDKPEVHYEITRISRARNQKPLSYTVNKTNDSNVDIKVTGGTNVVTRTGDFDFTYNNNNNLDRVRVEVFVPKKSNLRILTNREIRVENVTGELDLAGGDGAINVRDVEGKLKVASVDGKIRVIGFRGEIESKTADADMSLEGEFQKITATTGDGNIIVTLADDVSATINANTDSVSLEGIAPSRIKTVDIGESTATWRIGGGKANFNFVVGDGQVFIRNMNELKASL